MRGPLVILLAALLMPVPATSAQSSDDWVVTDHETLQDQIVHLDKDLIVKEGGTLTLSDVDMVVESKGNGDLSILVEDGGRLELMGGTQIHAPDGTYAFVVAGDLTVLGRQDAPVRISDVAGSTAGANVRQEQAAVDGLVVTGTASMQRFELDRTVGALVADEARSLELVDCRITTQGMIGIVIASSQTATIQDCEVTSRVTGIMVASSEVTWEGGVIHASPHGFGALVDKSSFTARGIAFHDANITVKAKRGSSVTLEGVEMINYTRVGVAMPPNTQEAADVEIRRSIFTPARGAGHSAVSLSKLGRGVFEGNVGGMHAFNGFSIGPTTDLVLRNNTLYGNGLYGIVLTNAAPDVLEGNHFGGDDLPEGAQVQVPPNGNGRIFEYRELTFRTTDENGSLLPGVALDLEATGPGTGGEDVTQRYNTSTTNSRARLTIPEAPYRAVDNNGTEHLITYTVNASLEGYLTTTVEVQPEDPTDVPIRLSKGTADTEEALSSTPIAPVWGVLVTIAGLSLVWPRARRDP